jgi:hypothetical protein
MRKWLGNIKSGITRKYIPASDHNFLAELQGKRRNYVNQAQTGYKRTDPDCGHSSEITDSALP